MSKKKYVKPSLEAYEMELTGFFAASVKGEVAKGDADDDTSSSWDTSSIWGD